MSQAGVTLVTNNLSRLLDEYRDSRLVNTSPFSGDAAPQDILHHFLSPNSVGESTNASFVREYTASFRRDDIGFRKIGFGQCGLVFERPGWPYVAKVSRPRFGDALWLDFYQHVKISEVFQNRKVECRVPAVYGHVSRDDSNWWTEMLPLLPEPTADFPMPSNALLSERILPLSRTARNALIDLYCPEALGESAKLDGTNRDCLARIYLGRRRTNATKSSNFTLRNFNLHLDQMVALDLPVCDFARTMGEALAVIHWDANVDGYDMEFVLGGEPVMEHQGEHKLPSGHTPGMQPHTITMQPMSKINLTKKTTSVWCLDFNLCTSWPEDIGWTDADGLINQLVIAFFENDPYYPLPLMGTELEERLWSVFQEAYLGTAAEVVSVKDSRLYSLPERFIRACIEREQRKLELGKGHGQRDEKQ